MDKAPSQVVKEYFKNLFAYDSAVGVLLLIMVVIAMIWANSPWAHTYHELWELPFTVGFEGAQITTSLHHWINDGLMAYFFFMIGLEIKREVISGTLSTPAKAALPVIGALGGMAVPALCYIAFTYGGEGAAGWGIPMATDIAFAIGLLALTGNAVSSSSKSFLTAMATADDIAAILIIAFFLSSGIDYTSLLAGGFYFLVMLGGNLLGVRTFWFYLGVGVFGLWVALLLSGVHATLAGVLAAFTIPARTRISEDAFARRLRSNSQAFENSRNVAHPLLTHHQVQLARKVIKDSKKALTPLQRVEENIKPFVNYLVLPIFALANAGVSLKGDIWEMVGHPIALGIIAGLVFGKLAGIFLSCRAAVRLGVGRLPEGTPWKGVAGLSMMAGIGFTMALFIAELALEEARLVRIAKIGILAGSLIAACIGITWLRTQKPAQATPDRDKPSGNSVE